MTAAQCQAYNERTGYPAVKSACVYCPYTDDARWRDMKLNRPEEFARAVAYDAMIRKGRLRGMDRVPYVHRSLKPLAEVDFSNAEDLGQLNWINECEGMCGV